MGGVQVDFPTTLIMRFAGKQKIYQFCSTPSKLTQMLSHISLIENVMVWKTTPLLDLTVWVHLQCWSNVSHI